MTQLRVLFYFALGVIQESARTRQAKLHCLIPTWWYVAKELMEPYHQALHEFSLHYTSHVPAHMQEGRADIGAQARCRRRRLAFLTRSSSHTPSPVCGGVVWAHMHMGQAALRVLSDLGNVVAASDGV